MLLAGLHDLVESEAAGTMEAGGVAPRELFHCEAAERRAYDVVQERERLDESMLQTLEVGKRGATPCRASSVSSLLRWRGRRRRRRTAVVVVAAVASLEAERAVLTCCAEAGAAATQLWGQHREGAVQTFNSVQLTQPAELRPLSAVSGAGKS